MTEFQNPNRAGQMEVAFKLPCDLSGVVPTKEWIAALLRTNPDLTGWPFFVDLWNARHPEYQPVIKNGVWEATMDQEPDEFDGGFDYWRIDGRKGLFFASRAYEDDSSPRGPGSGKSLEFGLLILRVAELIAVALAFGNYLCPDGKNIRMNWKWTNLSGRVLSSWANPERSLSRYYKCAVNEVTYDALVPMDTTKDQISVITGKVVQEVFLNFDGWQCPSVAIDQLVEKLLNRRL
ncbi:MAG: hypothetical protein ACFHXK_09245 [bacterium]